MALPMVIGRLAPWLAKESARIPGFWSKLQKAFASMGVAVGSSVGELVAYAKQNPMNASMVLAGLASVGASVSDLFSPDDQSDPKVRQQAVTLSQAYLEYLNKGSVDVSKVLARLTGAAEQSQSLDGALDGVENLQSTAEILRWAQSHYGSASQAIRAHLLNQAFFELSGKDVKDGFAILRL